MAEGHGHGQPESNFGSLPVEVQVKILKMANFEAKKTGRLVCKRWLSIIDEFGFCFVIKKISNQDCLDGIFATTKELDLVEVSNLDSTYRLPPATGSRSRVPRRIRKLIIGNGNTEAALMYFLKYSVANVSYLKIQKDGIGGRDLMRRFQMLIPKIDWGSMEKLSLDVQRCNCAHPKLAFRNTRFLLKLATIPNLAHLKFSVIHHFQKDSKELTELCVEFCKFLIRHKTTLKKLNISFNTSYTPPDISDQLIFLRSQLKKVEELKFAVADVKLCGDQERVNGSELGVIGLAMMAGVKKLKTFSYTEISPNPLPQIPMLGSKIGKLLEINGPNLTSVELGIERIKTSWLSTCTQLRTLTFRDVSFLNFEVNQALNLKSVTEFKFAYATLFIWLVQWIIENLPNLAILTLERSNMDLGLLQSLLALTSLRKIVMSKFIYDDSMDLVKQYCDLTDGLGIQMAKETCRCHSEAIITIQKN